MDATQSFRDVLARVRQTVLAGLEHGDLPFEQMVELAAQDRAAGQSPFYQVMFVLLEEGVAPWRLGSAAGRHSTSTQAPAKTT